MNNINQCPVCGAKTIIESKSLSYETIKCSVNVDHFLSTPYSVMMDIDKYWTDYNFKKKELLLRKVNTHPDDGIIVNLELDFANFDKEWFIKNADLLFFYN